MNTSRRQILAAAGLPAVTALCFGETSMAKVVNGEPLAQKAARSGRHFGAAVRPDQLGSKGALSRTVRRDCTRLTPELHMKWDALEPNEGEVTFGPADELVEFGRKNGVQIRGHTLLWDQSTPVWAKARIAGDRDWSLIERHFERVLGRYAAQVHIWDVVNEPIGADGLDLRPTVFRKAFGADYIARSLATAHAIAPSAKLAINDYGFDYGNPVETARRRAFVSLLRALRDAGAPLHAIGLQAHLDLGKGGVRAEVLARFLAAIADLDLEIAITELDVKEHDYALPLAERDRRVAAEVHDFVSVALAQPAVTGITTWGLTDRDSWLSGDTDGLAANHQTGRNRGLPYDSELAPKPMYFALADAFDRCGICG